MRRLTSDEELQLTFSFRVGSSMAEPLQASSSGRQKRTKDFE